MVRTGVRFTPPEVDVSSHIDWLLWRAIGPADTDFDPSERRQDVGFDSILGSTGLLIRSRSRNSPSTLRAELTPGQFTEVDRMWHLAVAVEMLHQQEARHLATVAGTLGSGLMFLKGMALRLGDYSEAGTRPAADIDILVERERAPWLSGVLQQEGYRVLELQRQEHHLPALLSPQGVVVEIHSLLSGLRIQGDRFAAIEDCQAVGLCEALAGWPVGTCRPRGDLLIAHLLVHALRQHGLAPGAYPQLQLLTDLQDLGYAGEAGERFLEDGFRWIEAEVSREEVIAVREILVRLESGEPASAIAQGAASAAVVLRHFIAGASDAEYRQSLKLEGLLNPLTDRGAFGRSVTSLKGALMLTRGQIDIIYGPPSTALGYLGWRLWRPFDLCLRTLRTYRAKRRLASHRDSSVR